MNILLKNNKKIFPVIAGIICSGLILNTITEIAPKSIIGLDYAYNQDNPEEIEIVNMDSSQIEEYILQESISTKAEDTVHMRKVEEIKNYLSKRNSPLAKYAEEFVKASEKYHIDYRLVAAISIIESGGGKNCFKQYNAWGWGKSGFDSWKDGIWTVSKGLGKYYAKGMTTPQLIAPSYCPPSASSWSRKVSYVMNEISE